MKHPKNDRQVSFSGGFRGPQETRSSQNESLSWKIRLMIFLIGVLLLSTPYLFTSLVHR